MKKTHFLQTLYLQKPLILILLIAALSTLPWIGLGDFYTKGEPREAGLAVYMINEGTWEAWVMPQSYADEFAYKPPLNHWLISIFSIAFNNGEVTPFTSRLPSAIAFIAMIGICFMFFARRRPVLESFISCLIMITCFEIHRAAMTTRVDMLLTFFMVASIIQLFTWYEKRRLGQLASAWLLLSLGTLVKGPVALILPTAIFGVYLLTQKINFFKATAKCLYVLIPALIIPAIWYYLAYQVQGDAFVNKAFGENIGRFLSMKASELGTDYELGVENPWYYYPITLLSGFLPWTILTFISLFFIKYKVPRVSIKDFFNRILNMDKVLLYSLIVIVVSLLFFTIPTSKRSVYIMLVYPFIAIFMARFFIWLSDYKPLSVRITTWLLCVISLIALIIVFLVGTDIISLEGLAKRERTIHDINVFSETFHTPDWIECTGIAILLIAIINSVYLLRKKMNLKILMAGFGLMLAINIFMDAFLLPAFKNSYSSAPFARQISEKYDLKDNTYVTNNLMKHYLNMYGLNFHLGNYFKNFEKELPQEGYFICGGKVEDRIKEEYGDRYNFTLLEKSNQFNDFKDEILLFRIEKKQSSETIADKE